MDGDLDGINDGDHAEDETELLDPGEMNTDDFHMRESEIQTETLELRYKVLFLDFETENKEEIFRRKRMISRSSSFLAKADTDRSFLSRRNMLLTREKCSR
jgi:hypothetical protein